MIRKEEVSWIKNLQDKKGRDEAGLFVAEGVKMVEEALLGTFKVKKIFATKDWDGLSTFPGFQDRTEVVRETDLARLSSFATPNKVLAVLEKPFWIDQLPDESRPVIALDALQDPGNLGAVLRCADWFGIGQVVLGRGCADVYGPKALQGSMGSFLRVRTWELPLEDYLPKVATEVFAAVLDGSDVRLAPKLGRGVLLVGNEGKGVSKHLLAHATHRVTIARKGNAESLNASVATGILLSHLLE